MEATLLSVMGMFPIAEWMKLKLAVAVGPFAQAAAIGAAARLWSIGEARRVMRDPLGQMGTGDSPCWRASDWFDTFEHRDEVITAAYFRITRLHEGLEALLELVAVESPSAPQVAHAWMEDRGDLERVAALLSRDEDYHALQGALQDLDRGATTYATTWGEIELPPLEGYALALAEEESPHHWWVEYLRSGL